MGKIKKWMKSGTNKLKHVIPRYKNLSDGWKGGIIALIIVTLACWILQGYKFFASHGFLDFIIGTSVTCILVMLLMGLISLVLGLLRKIPLFAVGCILAAFALLTFSLFNVYAIKLTFLASAIILLLSITFGVIIYKLIKGHYQKINIYKKISVLVIGILSISAIVGSIYWSTTTIGNRAHVVNAKKVNEFKDAYPSIDNPAKEGDYNIKFITYGSGEDLRREEFRKGMSILTNTVDGTKFLENWNFLRKKYLGFGADKLPINGSVWYPEGKGSFPLVIMVHGNHNMPQSSDTGYEYLGKLLASRGYIFASVDENFLNSSIYDDMLGFNGIKNETPARAIILLEHIKAFDSFNKSKDNPLYNKVDMNNISLIGHSRGGEAVAVAAAFNKLKTYPDDGSIKLNYNYNIRSIVAIAPTDGALKPTGKSVDLKDINYLVIHGSDDMDVTSFMGYKQYKRVSFTPDMDDYKASVYIYGVNHGQFNNNWGKQDIPGIGGHIFFDIGNLISKDDQNMIAKVLISAFLDSTIKGKLEYRNIFKDTRYADKWLPSTIYLNDYNDSKTTTICSYDEDMDINTTTLSGGSIEGENFKLWTEKRIKQKKDNIDNNSAYLSWEVPKDTYIPTYIINLPTSGTNITRNSKLVFSLADGDNNNDKLIDLSIKVYDKSGNTAELPISYFQPLQNTLKTRILKFPFNSLSPDSEAIFQKYIFSLNDFKKVNSKFTPEELAGIGFAFNKTKKGTVLLDDVGID
ncbi:hypothetical protein [Clostridium sp.]|uniref:hypothetical protein n=1 Tax=Clostridium sp. TaxID=1506 RepID=UPI003463F1B2